MSRLNLRGLAFVAGLLFMTPSARAEFAVPQLTGPIVDEAGIVESGQARGLAAALRAVRDRGGPQITVVTLKSLGGETIEGASIKIADAWKLGDAKADNGVLFLVALDDRKLRIEVGQGLEGVLTDLDSRRIIADEVTPLFRAGRASDGIVVGVRGILEKVAPDELKRLGESPPQAPRARKSRGGSVPWPILVGLFFLVAVFGRGGGGGRGRGLLGAIALGSLASGRGGGRGWSGSGGGWSGGGGGFSGGGASGGW